MEQKPKGGSDAKVIDDSNGEVKPVNYTPAENDYRGLLIRELLKAQQQRNSPWPQLNDMSYPVWYENNQKVGRGYIKPKANKEDKRIVTGITHEKENTLLSTLLNYNFEPNMQAHDENDMPIIELGHAMQAMVKKSRRMELYDTKRPLIYRELLDQGTVFVEETYVEQFRMEKDLESDSPDFTDLSRITWTGRLKKVYEGCEANLVPGMKVYLGNIKQYYITKQSIVFTQEIMDRKEAESIWGTWERWKNVPKTFTQTTPTDDNSMYADWSLATNLSEDKVEILKIQRKFSNEYMLMINGVMMIPIMFPLVCISPSGEYTLAKGDLEPYHTFAYSPSIPSKTFVDESVADESLKLMILKMQQSAKPALGVKGKRVLSNSITLPGKMTNDLGPDDVFPIFDSKGNTQADFNFFDFIMKRIDSKSVNSSFDGSEQQSTTATQFLEQKKQQLMKLGLSVDGVVNLETQLAWLRTYNIIEHWTKPIDQRIDDTKKQLEDVYRTISVDDTLEDGQKGLRVIKFTKNNTKKSSDIAKEDDAYEDTNNKKARHTYIDPDILRNLKVRWYYTITPTEKDGDSLTQMLFVQNIQQAIELFGAESLQVQHLKQRFATIIGEDYDKWFVDNPMQGAGMGGQMGGAQGQPGGGQGNQPMPGQGQGLPPPPTGAFQRQNPKLQTVLKQ